MSYQITSDNFQLSTANQTLIQDKLQKVERHIVDVGEELKTIRFVVNKGPRYGFIAKVELSIPTASFNVKGVGFHFETAVDDAIEELTRQVDKHKGKVFKKDRKLIRKIKKLVFFSGMANNT